MIRRILFRPSLSAIDLLTSSAAAALMFSGHWVASLPVLGLGAVLYSYGQRQALTAPADDGQQCFVCPFRKGR